MIYPTTAALAAADRIRDAAPGKRAHYFLGEPPHPFAGKPRPKPAAARKPKPQAKKAKKPAPGPFARLKAGAVRIALPKCRGTLTRAELARLVRFVGGREA